MPIDVNPYCVAPHDVNPSSIAKSLQSQGKQVPQGPCPHGFWKARVSIVQLIRHALRAAALPHARFKDGDVLGDVRVIALHRFIARVTEMSKLLAHKYRGQTTAAVPAGAEELHTTGSTLVAVATELVAFLLHGSRARQRHRPAALLPPDQIGVQAPKGVTPHGHAKVHDA